MGVARQQGTRQHRTQLSEVAGPRVGLQPVEGGVVDRRARVQPVQQRDHRVREVAPAIRTTPHSQVMPKGAETILLAEDEEGVRRIVQLILESLGYKVVHWSWASGDPSPLESRDGLVRRAQTLTKPGNILIFHINGRGVHTADALPIIVAQLRERGFRFVKLSDYLGDHHPQTAPAQVSVSDQLRQFLALQHFKQTAPLARTAN